MSVVVLLAFLRLAEEEQRRREEAFVVALERAQRRWAAAFAEIGEAMLKAMR